MEFWNLINEGISYYERGMTEYSEKYFDMAVRERTDGKYLIDTIIKTSNFSTMFMGFENNLKMFQDFFVTICATSELKNKGTIGADICEYILRQMLDVKQMFLKSVNSDKTYLLTENDDLKSTIKKYDDFREFLKVNSKFLLEQLEPVCDSEKIVRVTQKDFDMIIIWCYIILLTDYECPRTIDNGYKARSSTYNFDSTFSSTKTIIERDVESVMVRMPRLMHLYYRDEEYRKEYIKDLREILDKYEIKENSLVKVQKDFANEVFKYDKDNYRKYLSFEPFLRYNILGLKERRLKWYLILCLIWGPIGAHSFYAGKKKKGITQLILTLTSIGAIVSWIWAISDFVKAVINHSFEIE